MRLERPVIAGNWKMHHGPSRTREFFRDFLAASPAVPGRTVAFFPPAASLGAAVRATAARPDILLGVQNIHWEPDGAFTGEISAPIAADAGARLALVGHSERRHVFGETSDETARKVAAAVEEGLTPVLCVGETLAERDAGSAAEVVEEQLQAVFGAIDGGRLEDLLIAYEPVWAIGTGKTASPQDAAEMHGRIRGYLRARAGDARAEATPILYGGSVKPENAAELLAADDVDGLLVGGASLEPGSFARICAVAG